MNMEAPRSLTKDEIEMVLDATLPLENNTMFVQRDVTAKRVMLEQLRDIMREQLKSIKLVPNGISELEKAIYEKIGKSLSHPGYMIGITAAESFGQEVSQAALNSKRLTGVGKDLSGGLAAIKSVLSGAAGAIAPAYLYFTNPYYTVYDIFRVASEFTYCTLFGEGINSVAKLGKTELLTSDEHEEEYWVPLYTQIKGKIPFDYGHVIRFILNMNYIYQQQITVTSIIKAIENSNSNNLLYCVPSPLFIAEPYIDVYVNTKGIEDMVEKETNNVVVGSVETFYTNVFLSKDCHIKGIPHVIKINPEFVSLKESIYQSEKLSVSKESREEAARKGVNVDNIFYSKLNTHFMQKHGIPREKLEKLIEACQMEIVPQNDSDDNHTFILVKTDGRKPELVLTEFINKANEKQDQVFRDTMKNNKGILPPLSPIFSLSRQYYATVRMVKDKNVSMLIPFSKYKIIDIERCVSGDMYENLKVIGIIGLKNFLNEKIASLITGAGGSPMWMLIDLVMTSYMCRLGHMTKFNLKGVEETSGPASSMLWKDTFRNMQVSAAAGKRSNETQFNMIGNYYQQQTSVQTGSVADVKFLAGEFRGGSRVSDVLFDKQRESQYLIEKEKMRQMAREGKTYTEISKSLNSNKTEVPPHGVKIVPNPSYKATEVNDIKKSEPKTKMDEKKKRAVKPAPAKKSNVKPAVIDLDDL